MAEWGLGGIKVQYGGFSYSSAQITQLSAESEQVKQLSLQGGQ
jgi:hypothetical protein